MKLTSKIGNIKWKFWTQKIEGYPIFKLSGSKLSPSTKNNPYLLIACNWFPPTSHSHLCFHHISGFSGFCTFHRFYKIFCITDQESMITHVICKKAIPQVHAVGPGFKPRPPHPQVHWAYSFLHPTFFPSWGDSFFFFLLFFFIAPSWPPPWTGFKG